MDVLKQRIIKFIKQNQPINDQQAICTFGNVVVRDYMASPARQRLMAVYGRMG